MLPSKPQNRLLGLFYDPPFLNCQLVLLFFFVCTSTFLTAKNPFKTGVEPTRRRETSGSLWPATRAPSSWSLVKGAFIKRRLRWCHRGDFCRVSWRFSCFFFKAEMVWPDWKKSWKTGDLWMKETKRLNWWLLSTFCPSCFESDVFFNFLGVDD